MPFSWPWSKPNRPLSTGMKDEFLVYLEDRTPAGFIRFRSALIASPDYQAYSDPELMSAEGLLEQGNFAAAHQALMALMPSWIASPRIHWLLSSALKALGRQEHADAEAAIGALLMDAILTSGDGSEARP